MRKQTVISIRKNMYEKARQIAEDEGRSITAIIEEALKEYMSELTLEGGEGFLDHNKKDLQVS